MKKGLFITFEGADGCGKSTQLNLLKDYLEEKGFRVVVTREPGAKGLGEKIRELLLHYDGYVSSRCEAFMFLADRAQHIDTIVKNAVFEGKIVLCDRHTDSTIAYQGYGRGEDIEKLTNLNNLATGGFKPDLTLVYDVDVETASQRIGKDKDRMEQAGTEFQKKVQEGYRKIADAEPERVVIIDSTASIEEVFAQTKLIVEQLIKKSYNEPIKEGNNMSEEYRRWYDRDPILKEALELLRMQPDDTKNDAANFILKLQESAAAEVIEHVYDMVKKYQGKGNRWYDSDPVMLRAVELLRVAPPSTQRKAALKLLLALENKTFDDDI